MQRRTTVYDLRATPQRSRMPFLRQAGASAAAQRDQGNNAAKRAGSDYTAATNCYGPLVEFAGGSEREYGVGAAEETGGPATTAASATPASATPRAGKTETATGVA